MASSKFSGSRLAYLSFPASGRTLEHSVGCEVDNHMVDHLVNHMLLARDTTCDRDRFSDGFGYLESTFALKLRTDFNTLGRFQSCKTLSPFAVGGPFDPLFQAYEDCWFLRRTPIDFDFRRDLCKNVLKIQKISRDVAIREL